VSVASDDSYNPDALVDLIGSSPDWSVPVDAESVCPSPEWCSEPLIHELVFSMLMWESTMENAVKAMGKIHEHFVDYNELRVSFPHEIMAILGSRYQRAEDRSVRLLGALREIFHQNQRLSLEGLGGMSKREAKEYLSSIETLPRFVVSRILLLGLDAHAMPMDAKIARALSKAGLIKNAKNPDTIAVTLERAIRANQTLEVYTRMERWLISYENGS